MKTFDDLVFVQTYRKKNHGVNQWNAHLEIKPGLVLSVAYGSGVYSTMNDDEPETFEVALFFGNDMVPLDTFDEVLGWQSKDHINNLIEQITNNENFVKEKIDIYHEQQ